MDNENFPNIFDDNNEPDPQEILPTKKIGKSRSDFIITGLCGGIAKYFNTKPSVIRIFAILALLFGWWIILAYLIASYLIPEERNPQKLNDEEANQQRKVNFRTVLSGIMIFFGINWGFTSYNILTPTQFIFSTESFLMPFIFLGTGIYLILTRQKQISNSNFQSVDTYYRTKKDKLILGVCGGFSKYLNDTDSTTIRIVVLFGTLLTLGLLGIAYLYLGITSKFQEDVKE